MSKKLKDTLISKEDLMDYLENYSDFDFELSVLKMLRENGFECEHGGLYEDPATGKSREFDIRSKKTIPHAGIFSGSKQYYRVRLAIECKNIRNNFPVLISCVPRQESESYHQVAIVSDVTTEPYSIGLPIHGALKSRAKTCYLKGKHSFYKEQCFVGKSTVQVGRNSSDNAIVCHDNEVYDKWSQCLSSISDMISYTYWDGDDDKSALFFSAAFPIVVIPNDKLWVVEYDNDGKRLADPFKKNRCSCYVGKRYKLGTEMFTEHMLTSHIEIMTFDGLVEFIDNYLKSERAMATIFPKEGIIEAFDKYTR